MSDPDSESEATQAQEADVTLATLEAAEVSQAAAEAVGADVSAAEVGLDAGDETVNDQVIDTLAVVEAAVEAPQVAGASLEQVKAQAVGLALLNAVNAQQNAYVAANATVLAAVTRILAHGGADRAAETGAAGG